MPTKVEKYSRTVKFSLPNSTDLATEFENIPYSLTLSYADKILHS
ncbi:hypothetical protein BN938_0198 [Mucinivorans hirudinis]|uniref:Uncharacterized protein n=1 Tax=Mucinivorans hirudinis TaxID=1433126 RepID=A0A060RA87_9BACT|nr:hypothetical protein BN938_0198 [Mucinivorans hirudinis]